MKKKPDLENVSECTPMDFLDPKELARERAEAKSLRLKALASMALLNPPDNAKSHDLDHWSSTLPDDSCLAPRDGQQVGKTRDFIFLAALLERSKEATGILQCADSGTKGSHIYLPETTNTELPDGFEIKQHLKVSTIRGLFRKGFYVFRAALSAKGKSGMTLFVGGVELRPAGSLGDAAFWKFASRLEHPFSKDGDPLLDRLYRLPLLSHPARKGSAKAPAICPLDGPVMPISGKAKSPGWTWRHLVGRGWEMALCPKCLGELAQTGFSMN